MSNFNSQPIVPLLGNARREPTREEIAQMQAMEATRIFHETYLNLVPVVTSRVLESLDDSLHPWDGTEIGRTIAERAESIAIEVVSRIGIKARKEGV
jgi:hypothetical protein